MISVSVPILPAEAQLVGINYMHTLYVPGHHAGQDMAGAGTHSVNMIEGTAFLFCFFRSVLAWRHYTQTVMGEIQNLRKRE